MPEPHEPPPSFPPPMRQMTIPGNVYDLDVASSPTKTGGPPPLPMRRGGPPPVPNRSGAPPPLPARPNN